LRIRRAFAIGLIATFAAGSIDLGACGDKFLRVGRSARFRRYAAAYPASVLIYKPEHATPAGIREFEAILKQAGHRPVVVDNGTSIQRALAAAQYDLIIADYADASRIKSDLRSASSKAELLPILDKPTKAVEAEAEKQYACLIKLHAMTKYDALAEIDRLMELKQKGASAPIGK
jgi:CheY-like chemotaxis protein